MRHTFECHSSEPNFKFSCHYCNQSFSKYSSISSHLSRKHRVGDDNGNVFIPDTAASEDIHEQIPPQNYPVPDFLPRDTSAPVCDNHYLAQKSAALFLLTLKERYKLTQTAINFAVSQVQNMVAFALEDLKDHLCEGNGGHDLGK